jgi:hypothetical protein
MAKRIVYAKGTHGFNDFVYVDLLPDVKRARQFNVNVIIALLVLVTATYVLIYIPFSAKIFEFEELNVLNQDLSHELTLTQEEYAGYEINIDNIDFENDIETLVDFKVDLKSIIDDVNIAVTNNDGTISTISYSKVTNQIMIEVLMIVPTNYSILNTDLLGLNWVVNSNYSAPKTQSDGIYHAATYTIGVDGNAK